MGTFRHYAVGAAAVILLLIQIACGPSTASTPAPTLKQSAVPTPQGTPTGISVTSPPVVTPTYEGVTPTAMPLPTLSVATPTPAPSSTPAASPTLTPVPNSPANTPSRPRPTLHGDPTLEELLELEEEFNTTDLEIIVIASPDPALVGEKLMYWLRVINHGPNPASSTQVVATLPRGVSYLSDKFGCVQGPPGTLTCDMGEIEARESGEVWINVMIDAEALINEADPMTITNKASVASLVPMWMLDWGYASLVFPDKDPKNNRVSQKTLVVKK